MWPRLLPQRTHLDSYPSLNKKNPTINHSTDDHSSHSGSLCHSLSPRPPPPHFLCKKKDPALKSSSSSSSAAPNNPQSQHGLSFLFFLSIVRCRKERKRRDGEDYGAVRILEVPDHRRRRLRRRQEARGIRCRRRRAPPLDRDTAPRKRVSARKN